MPFRGKRLQLLAQPSFRWCALSCFLGTLGSGLSYVTLSWLILQADNSVAAVSRLMVCFWAPVVIIGPFFGIIADRFSRKWLVIGGNTFRGMFLIFLCHCFKNSLSAQLIYCVMFLMGVGFSFYWPTMVALIREIVVVDDLLYANSTVDIAYEVGNSMGMGLAGFLLAWLLPELTLFIAGIIFVLAAIAMAFVKITPSGAPKGKIDFSFIFKDLVLGFAYLRVRPKLIIVYSIQLLIVVAFMMASVLLAPFVKNVLQGAVSEFGYIEAALAIGIIIGGIFMPWVANRWGLMATLLSVCSLLTIFFAWFGVNRSINGAQILYFLIGMCLAVWPVIATKAQYLTDFNFQARMQSVFGSMSGILILGVYLLINFSSDLIAVQYFYCFEVVFILIAVCLLWGYRKILSDEKRP